MITVLQGDMLTILPTLDADSLDSCVCDPPYHLTSIVKRFGAENAAPAMSAAQRRFAKTGGGDRLPGSDQYGRLSKGFMGKQWDGGDVAFRPESWIEVLRVLKPGAHLLAFGGTRTFHRMACAIEDAGFEIRDTLAWLYGSGFPKSHDVSKGIDKAAGAERDVVGQKRNHKGDVGGQTYAAFGEFQQSRFSDVTEPTTAEARQWSGWGTALKPAYEPIILARKPLSEKTVVANVLRHGCGAINVDGCRVETDEIAEIGAPSWGGPMKRLSVAPGQLGELVPRTPPNNLGRWPANVIHDGSEEVLQVFPTAPGQQRSTGPQFERHANVYGEFAGVTSADPRNDSGSAARFFYTAKADKGDRLGSKHPTVKPVDLMRWLIRMVTPPGGTILDCFAGSGTTGMAALAEGFSAVLIEREAEYVADIRHRLAHVSGADAPLFA